MFSMPGAALNGPPPNPVNSPPTGAGGFSGLASPSPVGSQEGDNGALKAVVAMGADIDRGISALAQAIGGSDQIIQAKQLIQSALAQFLSAGPGALTASPTAPGQQFPGAQPSGTPQ